MNQLIKRRVYMQGSRKWAQYMTELTEMSPLEAQTFLAWHDGEKDLNIQVDLGITREQFHDIERSIEKKFIWGVLYCIDYTMRHTNENPSP